MPTQRLRFIHKIEEFFPSLHLTITLTRLQYNSRGLCVKELQDADSLCGGVLRKAESQQERQKSRTLEEFKASGFYSYHKY